MKNNKPENKLGKFALVNGSVVAVAPDEDTTLESMEGTEVLDTESEILVAESSNGSVIINSEEVAEEDLQYVYDEHTEQVSNRLAEKVRQENQKRAAKASTKTKIMRNGTSVVANPESYDDIDLDFLDAPTPQKTSNKN